MTEANFKSFQRSFKAFKGVKFIGDEKTASKFSRILKEKSFYDELKKFGKNLNL